MPDNDISSSGDRASRDKASVAAIVAADHADPFSFLGMHETDGELVVRTFQPGAARVAVIDRETGKQVARAKRIDDTGMFAATLPGKWERFPYLLRIEWNGESHDIEDPYRFPAVLGELDIYLLAEGTHLDAYRRLGAHVAEVEGVAGVNFSVWAPNARRVSVVGDFNTWDGRRHPMRVHHGAGIWEIFVPGVGDGTHYKFEIKARDGTVLPLKHDPYGLRFECPPKTAGVVYARPDYTWNDDAWMADRRNRHGDGAPISIYEVHLGSWRRVPEEANRPLSYRELADQLVPYVKDMGFTHIELLPISEHPFDGSWGYQPIGLFAPTARFGEPDDFRALVERCHQEGIGVILDWVPGHFPEDEHGLARFDGTSLYEHEDPRQGRHKEWGTLIYNFGRAEVANYLLSNALFWLDRYHIDGLRVDAVASMLYLDYSREDGEWIPNPHGGNENLDAIHFIKRLNELVYERHPGAFTVAEESTAWPAVSRPTYLGGLGFGFKWNMGWMHDTLRYMGKDPVHRPFHHDDLTFGLLYAFTENFVLPLSHDEVVHGKGSLIGRMPGDEWQRFANLRAYFTFMFTYPGKKLLFMGGEFGQYPEWNHAGSLDWHVLEYGVHNGVQAAVRDLNRLYRDVPALHDRDCDAGGFAWIDCHDHAQSVIAYLRHDHGEAVVVVLNFTPVVREGYRVGVPRGGRYSEVFNSDSELYGGTNVGNDGGVQAEQVAAHGRPFSLSLTLPPLAGVVLRAEASK